MHLDESVSQELEELSARGLRRTALRVEGPQGPVLRVEGREVICLCSNNYLGLANDPRLRHAARITLEGDGVGSGASRLISGSMTAHHDLEAALAGYLHKSRAVLFSTGYAANVGVLSALAGPDDVIFSDALNHASIIDGARMSRAPVHVYRHGDVEHLLDLLGRERRAARRALVVTDGLFSMDGDVPDLAALHRACEAHGAALVVDEAHALGVLGPQGRGACAEAGVEADIVVGTLGKAFGVAGAFAAASAPVARLLENRARSYVFSTAPPPVTAAAAVAALEIVRGADEARARLRRHSLRLREGLRDIGYEVPLGHTPIVPIAIGCPERTMELSRALLERGVFAHGIRPPTVPTGTSRIRAVPMATHTDAHIDRALDVFAELREPRP